MTLPQQARIVEVGPRDGLQNEPHPVPTAVKVALIEKLAAAGLPLIEATSFVSAKWVPQLADAADVMRALTAARAAAASSHRTEPLSPHRAALPGAITRFSVLTPNLRGFDAAVEAGADEVAIFAAASETFSQKNINCSIAESLKRFEPVLAAASALDIPVRGYVSCVVGCPYEGAVAPRRVAVLARELADQGCYEVSLGDTIGVGTPASVARLLDACLELLPAARLAGHFHDTYGMAVANIHAALRLGVATFDSSVAGLGGCPYAPGASGNVATEDVLYLLQGLGIDSGVDLDAVIAAGSFICAELGRSSASRVARALTCDTGEACR